MKTKEYLDSDNLCHLGRVAINETVLYQYINLDDDKVTFTSYKGIPVVDVDSSGYTTFYAGANVRGKHIGKFGYATGRQEIQFTPDANFFISNDADIKSMVFPTSDFIKAERLLMKTLIKDYFKIFIIQ